MQQLLPNATKAERLRQLAVVDNLFTWIKQADAAFANTVVEEGWQIFLRKGPGTLRPNATKGAYHVLDYMANVLKFKGIEGIEVTVTTAGRRVIDIFVREGGVLIRKELKNLDAGAPFKFAAEVLKDIKAAKAAATVDNIIDAEVLAEELRRVEYVFRGSSQQMNNVARGLETRIRLAPGKEFRDLESLVIRTFQDRGLPF